VTLCNSNDRNAQADDGRDIHVDIRAARHRAGDQSRNVGELVASSACWMPSARSKCWPRPRGFATPGLVGAWLVSNRPIAKPDQDLHVVRFRGRGRELFVLFV
jgi:hypothetical protein